MPPSLSRQIELALLAVYRPGVKKHELPPADLARYVLSGRTLENYLSWDNWWAAWVKEHLVGVRILSEAHLAGQPFVQALIDSGRSAWTIAGVVAALRKLEYGVEAYWGRPVTLIAPEALINRPHRILKERVRRGAYPASDLQRLRVYLEPAYRAAFDACKYLGLRRREVVSIQARDVDLVAATFQVKNRDGAWQAEPVLPGYAGVVRVRRGKGGRPREVPVPDEFRPDLIRMLRQAAGPTSHLWPVQAKAFGYGIVSACRRADIPSRGVHGLRHSWALQQYYHLRRQLGYSDEHARRLVSWWLGHNRLAVTGSYVPRRPEPGFDLKRYVAAEGEANANA